MADKEIGEVANPVTLKKCNNVTQEEEFGEPKDQTVPEIIPVLLDSPLHFALFRNFNLRQKNPLKKGSIFRMAESSMVTLGLLLYSSGQLRSQRPG